MRHFYCLITVFITTICSLAAQSYPSYFSISTNSPVCDGQLFQISAAYTVPPSGTSVSFRWSGPNGYTSSFSSTISRTASATTAGVYSVTMTFTGTNQGTATASTTVSLGTSKPMGLVYDGQYYLPSRSICSPTSLSLAAYPDESRSLNSATYRWTGPNGFSSTDRNPVVAQGVAGLYILEATYPGNCGVGKDTVQVYNNTLSVSATAYTTGSNPQVSATFCLGAGIEFRAGAYTPSGTTVAYKWSGPDGFTSTSQNVTLTSATTAMSGTYSVTATFSGSCAGTATVSRTIRVDQPSMYISGNPAACSGGQLSLEAMPMVNYYSLNTSTTYQWNGPNGFTSTAKKIELTNVTSDMAGLYSVRATLSGACTGTVTASNQVRINTPIVGVFSKSTDSLAYGDQYCPGTSFNIYPIFFNASSNFPSSQSTLSYQWRGPNGFTSSDRQPTIPTASTLASGLYSLTVTVAGECSGTYTDTREINIGKPISYVSAYPLNGVSQQDTYCPGATVVLAANNNPANAPVTAYQWRGPNGFTSSAQSLTLASITAQMAGVYSLTTVYGGQCASKRVEFANVIVGTPNVYGGVFRSDGAGGGNPPLCVGNYYTLAPNAFVTNTNDIRTNNTHSFEWTLPDGTTSASPLLTIASANTGHAGRYILKTTLGGVCASAITRDTTDIVVGIEPPNIRASNPFITRGRSATLFAENCVGSTVQWSDGQTGFTITVAPTQTTTYLATCVGYERCVSPQSVPLTIQVSNQPEADLSLKMAVSNRTPALGQSVTLTIAITNSSAQEARNVQIESRLPATLSVISAGTFQTDGLVLTATVASIPANSTINLPVQLAATAAGDFWLTAQLMASDNPDPDSWPASGTNDGQDDAGLVNLRTTIGGALVKAPLEPNPADLPEPRIRRTLLPNGLVDLSLNAFLDKASSSLNEIITVTLSLNNVDNRRLLSPEITCRLPAGLTFIGGTGLIASGQEVTLAGGNYYSQWPQTFSFQARVIGTVSEPIKAQISYCDWDDVDSKPGNGFTTGEDDTTQVSLRVR